MSRLKGQVAFVTGAGRGIGQAMAVAFASEGALVGVADIDAATAQETVREIESNGGIARAFGGGYMVAMDRNVFAQCNWGTYRAQ